MKFEPLHNNILVKQDENDNQYGSIIVADLGENKPKQGVVLAIGPGTYTITGAYIYTKSSLVGKKVIFPSFGGTKITIEGEELIILKDTDILGILNEE
jgi:chaperonin GroES